MSIRAIAREHTGHVCLSDPQVSPFAWETSGSLPFTWGTSGPLPFTWVTSGSLPSVKNYRPYISFQVPSRNMNILFAHVFFCLWLVIGTYILLGFFPVICWSYLWTEISVTLSINNKLYSHHHLLYFSFLWKPLCWCYIVTTLNLLSSLTALCH